MGCKPSAKRSLFCSNRKRKLYTDQEDGAFEITPTQIIQARAPQSWGFLFSRYLFLHSYVRIRYIDDILLLIIPNFMSWALEKHPEIQHVNMQLV